MPKVDPTIFKGLEWRCIGPYRGGRVVAVAGHPTDPLTFYFGACAGGVWKTTDGGLTWECVSDGYFNTAAVGAIAVAKSDPNVVYVGMGECCIRGNVSHGDGVYKSADGGKTWVHLGLSDTRHIARIRIHPANPDVVYVAALGHAFGPNEERGIFRSTDGGKTWERILYRGPDAGAIDLIMDPTNPRILYAAFWEARRTFWNLTSGGPGSGIFKSTDGGNTWVELTNNPGLPTGLKGRIGLAISAARPERVWAIVEAVDGAVFRSDDGGATWERLSEQGDLRRRAWYYQHIVADPQDPETVYVLNIELWKSVDGGRTFNTMASPHGDHHDLWIDPSNPKRMILGHDGGASVTFDGGLSWTPIDNQPTAQMYHVTTDNQFPYRVYGSQQDNTAISIPSRSVTGAITQTEWYKPGGGESGYIAVKPDDPNIVVGGAIGSGLGNGRLILYDRRTCQERNITVWPEATGMGVGAKDLKYRFQWTFPILFSPHDPNTLYVTANVVFRSRDLGSSWEVISPDLTRNDPTKLEPSGGPITRDNTGAEVYCTIFAFAESPHEPGVFWAGSDDGLIHLSRDGGKTWQNVTPPDLPEWTLISMVECSPHDPATVYVAATRYKLDDFRPYLYKTNDYGRTWTKIIGGIPDHDFTRCIREDPVRRGLLFAGTETGLYVSFDDGENWVRFHGANLPVVPIYDLVIKDDDLIVATHGRGFWILDDITPLRQLGAEVLSGPTYLFRPRPTVRFKTYRGFGNRPLVGQKNYRMAGPVVTTYKVVKKPDGRTEEVYLDAGKNPPDGVIVTYYFKEKPDGEVTLTFLDAAGKVIKTFTSREPEKPRPGEPPRKEEPRVTAEAGLNRFVWDMRYPDAVAIPEDRATFNPPRINLLLGPVAPPGTYQVQLKVGDLTLTQPFEIVKDPRVRASRRDLEAQFRLLLEVRDRVSETHQAVLRCRDVRRQLEELSRRLQERTGAAELALAARELAEKLRAIEAELWREDADSPLAPPSALNFRLAALATFIDSADYAPARQHRATLRDLWGRIRRHLRELERLYRTELAAFNRRARRAGLPTVLVG